jgi:hypothetical protein
VSLVRRATAGAVAGAVGTAAMDLLLYSRYRRDDGKDSFWRWEFAAGVMSWDEASAPGQVGKKLEQLVTRRQPPDNWARATTNLTHWATGIGWGIQYGTLARKAARHSRIGALALGPTAWISSYVVLPPLKLYKPIWAYDARTLADDLSAHLVYGIATAAAFAALNREKS